MRYDSKMRYPYFRKLPKVWGMSIQLVVVLLRRVALTTHEPPSRA